MEISNIGQPLRYVFLFIVMLLAQVLICNNILLFGVAVPFIYIFFIIVLPLNVSLNVLMLISFFMGFFVDLCSDTLGLNCLACLILAVVKKPVYYAYMPHEDKSLAPSPSPLSMGWDNYLKFILTVSGIFCILVFGIELFSFASFGRIVLMSATSTLFTMLLLIGTDALFNKLPAER